MIKIIAKKDFIRKGEPIFAGDEIKVNSVEELVKLNEKGFIEPLTLKDIVQFKKELENLKDDFKIKKEEE